MSYAYIGYKIYQCSEMKGISLYVDMFLVNVLSVMQDIQKVKHIYFSFLEMHDISMFEGSRENELFC